MTLSYLLGCAYKTNRSLFVEISLKTQKDTSYRGRRLVGSLGNGDVDETADIFVCHTLLYCCMLCPNFIDIKHNKTMKLYDVYSLTWPFAYFSCSSPLTMLYRRLRASTQHALMQHLLCIFCHPVSGQQFA